MSDTKTIEMTLPKESVIRRIFESASNDPTNEDQTTTINAPNGVKTADIDFDDEAYNKMMSNFLNSMRLQAETLNKTPTPKDRSSTQYGQTMSDKVKTIREQLADNRRPLKFRKGFLNTSHNSTG